MPKYFNKTYFLHKLTNDDDDIDSNRRNALLRYPNDLHSNYTLRHSDNAMLILESLTLVFTASEVKFSHQIQPNNRVIQSTNPEKVLMADFQKLRFENQASSDYIIRILTNGIIINEKRYHYVGQSNSHIKQRKCLLLQADDPREIQRFLDGFGDWSKFKSVAKLAKRIGLLFSSGDKAFNLPTERYKIIDDIERNDFCFTDGCGFVSKDTIKRITSNLKLVFRENRLYPSVIQIRYQGFKGILLLGNHLSKKISCEFRKSMNKFNYRGPDDFFITGYSKPYTFGRLNTQTIMLLSALKVPDDVFVKKQAEHFARLDLMLTDLSIAFEYLLTNGQVDLAGKLFENGFTEEVNCYLKKSFKQERETSLKPKRGPDGGFQEKLRLIVEKSRIVYGACDPTPTYVLRENECFFRPTIQNKPTTILGPIFCVRNPCYHAGDIVVLNAVDIPECKNIVDVLVFSVNGDVPAAHRSAGGDLDGDKFFVCWDKELMPPITVESYGYPGAKENTRPNIKRSDLIKHFSTQSNAGVARCADLFLKWADAKGPRCEECLQINKLFSHAVDGSSVNIADVLKHPPKDEAVFQSRIWNKLVDIAMKRREDKANQNNRNDDNDEENDTLFLMIKDRDELCAFLEEDGNEATDYEIMCFLFRWCRANNEDIKEFLYFLDFSAFYTHEKLLALATGEVPRHLLFNALHMSNILKPEQISHFNLGEADHHWKLFHMENEITFSTNLISDLSKAIANFRRVFIALEFNHELTICISLHGNFEPDLENNADGKIVVYGFTQSGRIKDKKFCQANYKLFYNETYFQVYVSHKRNTFVWMGIPKKLDTRVVSLNELNVKSSISVAIDKLNNRTSRVTSKIQKKMIVESEIYVVSNQDGLRPRYQAVNPDYKIEVEELNIDANYNPINPKNPENDDDRRLLSCSYSNDLDELMRMAECWAKYGVYDKIILAYVKYLETNLPISDDDLQQLIDFSTRNPIVHSPLIEFLSRNYSPESSESLEIPSTALVSLIGTCLKSCKSSKETLIMENVLKLFSYPVTLSMYQAWQVLTNLVTDYPYSKTSLEYLDRLFDLLEKRQPVTSEGTYFMHQVKTLCYQTLEELSTSKRTPKNRYRAYKSQAHSTSRYTLMSEGPISVKVRSGDIILLKRLNRKSVEPISKIRAVVISTDRELSIDISWVPRDITIATWEVIQVGNIIGFKYSMEAFKKLYPTQDEKASTLLNILLDKQDPTTTRTIENGDDPIQGLNLSQQTAVYQAENRNLTLWQGPAGTGKTKSIFQLILRLLDRNPSLPILVTAATNAAVDNVALLLVAHGGIEMIRIGDKSSIHPNLLSITLEAGLDGAVRRIHSKKSKELLKDAKVIFATCVGCGTTLLDKKKYDFVIVDEASQVAEPTCLIPLAKDCARFVLVGDHKQLRPFCLPMAEIVGYSISLFERMNNNNYPICLLDTQYRMHPGISEFPNVYFYERKLRDGIGAIDRPLVNGFAWPNVNVPVAFVQVAGEELSFKDSKYNQAEVDKIVRIVELVAESGSVAPDEIGIISLYSAQSEKMKAALQSCQNSSVHSIEVKTADGFQGREKQLILITCVRCNGIGNIGFLDDPRRFNVMLTRAKRGLIIFGDQKTLRTNEMWKNWFTWSEAYGLVSNT
ncbi:5460_t:CDS:2 [Diversispora eburnea]|uniref:5460_t:CDS:1 n=1 Tax=Diversispora eburnea TaxID=1213867 RepID=A0A9N8WEI5_9GLOM|nr:5460_t:CDS:2 [Diversispora eburnea]